jgi:hypothetical protein
MNCLVGTNVLEEAAASIFEAQQQIVKLDSNFALKLTSNLKYLNYVLSAWETLLLSFILYVELHGVCNLLKYDVMTNGKGKSTTKPVCLSINIC